VVETVSVACSKLTMFSGQNVWHMTTQEKNQKLWD